jgi:enoyl-CoA hydratase
LAKSDGGEAPSLKVEMRDKVAIITIDRPQARNAINTEIRLELPRLFTELGEKGEARVIVLRGAGSQAFVSGADLRELQTMDRKHAADHYLEFEHTLTGMEACKIPTIAMISGFALGGGCEIAAACDFRIAASDARLGMPIARLGHQIDLSNTRRLVRLVGAANAKALLMSDHFLSAEDARRLGLVNWVVPTSELEAYTLAFAATLASKAPLSLRCVKDSIRWVLDHPTPPENEDISQFCAPLFETEDFKEGVGAFFEKRKPVFKGK